MADSLTVAAVAAALNIDASEFEKIAKDGDKPVDPKVFEERASALIKDQVTREFTTKKDAVWDEGFQAANRKILSTKEKALREKYPGLEGKDIDEMFDNAYKHGGATDWSKDPKVQGELTQREQRIAQLQKDLDNEKATSSKKLTMMKLERIVPDVLKDKFTIPTNEQAASKRLSLLMSDLLQEGKVEPREVDGKWVPWNIEANKQLHDPVTYKPLTFEDWILGGAALIYDTKDGSGHQAPGNKDEIPKGPSGTGYPEIQALTTWDQIYEYKGKINLADKGAQDKLTALKAHVDALRKSGKLGDN